MELLKIEAKTTTLQIKMVREKERSTITRARDMMGVYPRRHKLGQEEPKAPERVIKAETWALANKAEAQKEIDLAYERYWGLTHFRKNVLRKHARNVHLALTFLKGQPLEHAEKTNHTDADFEEIEKIVFTFGLEGEHDPRTLKQQFERWTQEGTRHVENI